jgi:hypothetical protein
MDLRSRFRVAIESRFLSGDLPDLGQLAISVDGGSGPALNWRAGPSSELLSRGDEALARISSVAWKDVSSRSAHRLNDVLILAQSASANSCLPHAIAAVQSLDEWIAVDGFGQGIAWEHTSDVAWRLMRLALLLSLVEEEIDPGLRMRIAGSAQHHAAFLRQALVRSSGVHPRRSVLQASALVVAGLVWPGLEQARGWWSEGLGGLKRHLGHLVLPDGSPVSALSDQVESMEAAGMAHAVCRISGVAFPVEAEGALIQGVEFLRGLETAEGLVGVESFEALNGEGSEGRFCRVWASVNEGAWAVQESETKGWKLHAFRSGGWVAAHCVGKSQDFSLSWALRAGELGGQHPVWGAVGCSVFANDARRGGGLIERARVDGRKLQITAHAEQDGMLHRKKAIADASRLVVEDRVEGDGELRVSWIWRLAPGWSLVSETELTWAVREGRRLKIGLSKDLDWRVESGENGLVFRATKVLEPGNRIQNRFELGK